MQFVQVNLLQTWKIAAFLVAFFSSFFSYYTFALDYSSLPNHLPKSIAGYTYQCTNDNYSVLGYVFLEGIYNQESAMSACRDLYQSDIDSRTSILTCPIANASWINYNTYYYEYTNVSSCDSNFNSISLLMKGNSYTNTYSEGCPPDDEPLFTFFHIDENGISACYNPADIQSQIDDENQLDKNEDYCKNIILDSGNNTEQIMCYTAQNGSSCTVSKQETSGYSYYAGTNNNALGCGDSDDPPFDVAGTGDSNDNCVFMGSDALGQGGENYCQASVDKHCKTVQGSQICDDGCIQSSDKLYCDVKKHPDVGEGDSDYFNDNGTCSVTSASSSKGNCEEMGGIWDDTQDYQETTCPSGGGTCSIPSGGFCGACMDAGGVWTPDPNQSLSEESKASLEIAALVKKSNEKLTQIENTNRKMGEATISTIKSGDGKIVGALNDLIAITKTSNKGATITDEKSTFTTTTAATDKTKLSSLFGDASKATLNSEIAQLKTDTTTFINSARAEATALMSITVPNSTGYQVRNLTLSQGTFDLSFTRFGDFFSLLAGPVMLICSIIAGFILLGGKNS